MKKIFIGIAILFTTSVYAQSRSLLPATSGTTSYLRWDDNGTPLGYVGYFSTSTNWLYLDNTGNNPVRNSFAVCRKNNTPSSPVPIHAIVLSKPSHGCLYHSMVA